MTDEGAISELCDYIAAGGHMPGFCKERQFSYTAVRQWVEADSVRSAMYARAREDRADVHADEIIAIGEEDCSEPVLDKDGKLVGTVVSSAAVQRNKLRSDNRKWLASKMKQRVYGDKVDVNASLDLKQATNQDLLNTLGALAPGLAAHARQALGEEGDRAAR